MPELPTISVTGDQFDRIAAAFPGETPEEKVEAYQSWLTKALKAHVTKYELDQLAKTHAEELAAKRAEINNELA